MYKLFKFVVFIQILIIFFLIGKINTQNKFKENCNNDGYTFVYGKIYKCELIKAKGE